MAENDQDTADGSVKTKKMPRGTPFTPETSKAVQARAAAMRKLRKEMRQKLLETVANEGLEKYLAKAIKTGDDKLMNIVVAASKLTGVDWTSSEEAVQRVDAKVDQKTQGKVEIVVSGLDG